MYKNVLIFTTVIWRIGLVFISKILLREGVELRE